MNTAAFILAAMNVVAPDVDHTELATAMTNVVESQPYAQDEKSRQQVAALLVAVAFREGSLKPKVEGDHDAKGKPRSFCTMQIHSSSGGSSAMNDDPELCFRTGLDMLRTSQKICPKHPVAFYAAGPAGCASPRAQRISADRIGLARRIAAKAVARESVNEPERVVSAQR